MRKKFTSLMSLLLLAVGTNVYGQEVCQIDADGVGITSTAKSFDAGTVVGTSDNLTISLLTNDDVKSTTCMVNNSGFIIGGVKVDADGITGSNNPKNSKGSPTDNPTYGIPTKSGFSIQIQTKSDGYVYVCGKLASNKAYFVFEDGIAIGYDIAMYPYDSAGNPTLFATTIENDSVKDGVSYPYRTTKISDVETIINGSQSLKKNGEGVIIFPVKAGSTYTVGAGGSKISVCAAVLSSTKSLQVILPETTYKNTTYSALTLIEGQTGESETISIADGKQGYISFSSSNALDFTDVTAIEAYRAGSASDGVVSMQKIEGVVPANTGVILKAVPQTRSAAVENIEVPITSATAEIGDNMLKACVDETTVTAEDGTYKYVLGQNQDKVLGFYLVKGTASYKLTKQAYLESSESLAASGSSAKGIVMNFDDGTNGINTVKTNTVKADNAYYTLSGVRVAKPSKGLYIVNGKKVVVK